VRASGSPALYDVLVGLHVASAVVGFGAVAVSGAYGAVGRHAGRPGRAEELRRFFETPLRAELLILAVPFFGAGALAVRPGGHDFASAWVLAGLGIWVAAAAVLLGLVRPAENRLRRELGGAGPGGAGPGGGPGGSAPGGAAPGAAHAPAPGGAAPGAAHAPARALMWAAAASDFLFVAALFVMVTQP
jgi:hypothetical protein